MASIKTSGYNNFNEKVSSGNNIVDILPLLDIKEIRDDYSKSLVLFKIRSKYESWMRRNLFAASSQNYQTMIDMNMRGGFGANDDRKNTAEELMEISKELIAIQNKFSETRSFLDQRLASVGYIIRSKDSNFPKGIANMFENICEEFEKFHTKNLNNFSDHKTFDVDYFVFAEIFLFKFENFCRFLIAISYYSCMVNVDRNRLEDDYFGVEIPKELISVISASFETSDKFAKITNTTELTECIEKLNSSNGKFIPSGEYSRKIFDKLNITDKDEQNAYYTKYIVPRKRDVNNEKIEMIINSFKIFKEFVSVTEKINDELKILGRKFTIERSDIKIEDKPEGDDEIANYRKKLFSILEGENPSEFLKNYNRKYIENQKEILKQFKLLGDTEVFGQPDETLSNFKFNEKKYRPESSPKSDDRLKSDAAKFGFKYLERTGNPFQEIPNSTVYTAERKNPEPKEPLVENIAILNCINGMIAQTNGLKQFAFEENIQETESYDYVITWKNDDLLKYSNGAFFRVESDSDGNIFYRFVDSSSGVYGKINFMRNQASSSYYGKKTGLDDLVFISHFNFVGFLQTPNYMLETRVRNDNGKFKVEFTKVDNGENSVPSTDGNLSKILNHCHEFRNRRYGRVFCLYYEMTGGKRESTDLAKFGQSQINFIPHATDGKKIYNLGSDNYDLDPYTYEALKFALDITKLRTNFELLKIQFTKEGEPRISDDNSQTTHSKNFFACVSVLKPDDVFFNKDSMFPYDVKILSSNVPFVYQRGGIPKLHHKQNVKTSPDIYKNHKNPLENPVTHDDRIWIESFKTSQSIMGRSHNYPSIEVHDSYDESSRGTSASLVVYSTPEHKIVEAITSEALNVYDVARIIQNNKRVSWAGHVVDLTESNKKYFLEQSGNKHLKEILNKVGKPKPERKEMIRVLGILFQKIANTIYAKMVTNHPSSGLGKTCDNSECCADFFIAMREEYKPVEFMKLENVLVGKKINGELFFPSDKFENNQSEFEKTVVRDGNRILTKFSFVGKTNDNVEVIDETEIQIGTIDVSHTFNPNPNNFPRLSDQIPKGVKNGKLFDIMKNDIIVKLPFTIRDSYVDVTGFFLTSENNKIKITGPFINTTSDSEVLITKADGVVTYNNVIVGRKESGKFVFNDEFSKVLARVRETVNLLEEKNSAALSRISVQPGSSVSIKVSVKNIKVDSITSVKRELRIRDDELKKYIEFLNYLAYNLNPRFPADKQTVDNWVNNTAKEIKTSITRREISEKLMLMVFLIVKTDSIDDAKTLLGVRDDELDSMANIFKNTTREFNKKLAIETSLWLDIKSSEGTLSVVDKIENVEYKFDQPFVLKKILQKETVKVHAKEYTDYIDVLDSTYLYNLCSRFPNANRKFIWTLNSKYKETLLPDDLGNYIDEELTKYNFSALRDDELYRIYNFFNLTETNVEKTALITNIDKTENIRNVFFVTRNYISFD